MGENLTEVVDHAAMIERMAKYSLITKNHTKMRLPAPTLLCYLNQLYVLFFWISAILPVNIAAAEHHPEVQVSCCRSA